MVPLLLDFIGERDGHLHGALLVGRMLLYLHAMDHVHTGAVVVVALKDQICFFFFCKCPRKNYQEPAPSASAHWL